MANGEMDVLVVVSKLKNYIRSTSGMNTAGNVAPALSDIIRRLCDGAVEKAKEDGRKTIMDRDFPPASTF
jgi:histone H3/H4